jgi:outer membrane receptor for ferric coprogen and ferric-rhodotorulic acid
MRRIELARGKAELAVGRLRHRIASLNVNNLFDKKYYDNVGFYNGVYWGDPRTVTLSLDWKL